MEQPLEHPVIKPETYEELESELLKFDAEPVNVDKARAPQTAVPPARQQIAEPEAKPSQEKQPDNSESEVEKPEAPAEEKTGDDRPRDDKGRFVPKEGDAAAEETSGDATPKPAEAEKPADDKAADSNYERAKKEAQRREVTWQKINERKAELDARERQLKEIEQRVTHQRQRTDEPRRDANGNEVYSSQRYRETAKLFLQKAKNGELAPDGRDYLEMSEQAQQAAETAATREAKEYQERFEEHQKQIALDVLKTEPELADANSPLAKEMQAVFADELEIAQKAQRPSVFQMLPDGFKVARDIAKLRMQAASASELQEKLTKAQAEIARLNKLTSVNGSGPTQQRAPKSFEEMTTDEQIAYMDKQAREAGQNFATR